MRAGELRRPPAFAHVRFLTEGLENKMTISRTLFGFFLVFEFIVPRPAFAAETALRVNADDHCALSKLHQADGWILVRAVKIECSAGECSPYEKKISVKAGAAQRGGLMAHALIPYVDVKKHFVNSPENENSVSNLLIEVLACSGKNTDCTKNATQLSHWKGGYLQALGQAENLNLEVWADVRSIASVSATQCTSP